LEGFLEELASLDEEKVLHVVEGFSVGGVIGDEVAFVEEGIEFGVEEFTPAGRGRFGLHEATSL
jgi:hypothetical protein